MGERDGGVREGRRESGQLFGMLRGLQHPGLRAAEEGECLQHLLHIRVVLGLIECQIGIAPTRHAGQPFQDVAGEIKVEDLDLFLDRLGELVMHGRHHGHVGEHRVVFGPGASIARVDPEDVGPAATGRDGFLALPVGQCPTTPIGSQQIDQVRGARSRHTHHDDRLLDLDRLDLRVPPDQIGQRDPISQQPDYPGAQGAARELGQVGVSLDRVHMGAEACGEIARVPQIVGTRAGDGLVDHLVDIEGDRARFGVVKNLSLHIGQPRRGEVVDINGLRRGTHCYISVLVVMFGAPHRTQHRPTYRPSWPPRRDPRRDQ